MRKGSGIHYRSSDLFVDGVRARDLAVEHGTPLYVYSARRLRENFRSFAEAFRGIPHVLCYALKANSNLSVLKVLSAMGCGADIVSGGELHRALRAGIPAGKIVFAGVGKREEEIREALRRRILMLNVESREELDAVSRIARDLRMRAPISLRVNPDVDPGTHPYISTGRRLHKFGVELAEARRLYRAAARVEWLEIRGIHMHLGSQISTAGPFVRALRRVMDLVDELARGGIRIRYVDMGGGVGIRYREASETLVPGRLAEAVDPLLAGRDMTLILEPGRAISADAGILVTRVLYCKETGGRKFVVVDAGMNDMIRPSLYGAHHEIIPVRKVRRGTVTADIVGPVCETGDFLALERSIARPISGDLLAILNAGAYGWSMSSNYNSRTRAAEILVDGREVVHAGRRETMKDLLRREKTG